MGDTIEDTEIDKYTFPEFVFDPQNRRTLSFVFVSSSIKLSDAEGNLMSKEGLTSRDPGSYEAVLDTGSNCLNLPKRNLLEDMVRKLRVKLMQKGHDEERIAQMWRKADNGFIFVKEGAFSSLPVIGFTLSEGRTSIPIKIHPKHYCVKVESGERALFVQENPYPIL
ncbi:hypothetical protein FOZ63_019156, partial [Perkinsus olseni]